MKESFFIGGAQRVCPYEHMLLQMCIIRDALLEGKRKTAFTLAEVLITLGIIGIIAAITIPVLQSKIQQQIYKNRWKKAYAEINQAYLMVQAQEDLSSYWEDTSVYSFEDVVQKILKQYVQVKKLSTKGELHSLTEENLKYKSILGKEFTMFPNLHFAYSMNDLTIFYWNYYSGGAAFWFDVNGFRRLPNTFGKDVFALEIRKDKVYPFGQFATGDWCSGAGSSLGVKYVQVSDDSSIYAGLGCSYDYLYGKK